jgi:23S rRNA (adenine2503-C2)-methyltransferase
MKIDRLLEVPTGHIAIATGDNGRLEFLSLRDYGQAVNLNQHKRVEHGPMLPLEKKWVVTISTQYGCSMRCNFCDVPKVGPGKNATFADMVGQVNAALSLHPEVNHTARLNVHFARMGEPTWNPDVLAVAYWLRAMNEQFVVHPVVSTMMPRANHKLDSFLQEWMRIKNEIYFGNAGLQLSINSTDENERDQMFNGNSMHLFGISELMRHLPFPKGRKITLNFAIAGYTINAEMLADIFPPNRFVCKLTPMHKTTTALMNGVKTRGDYTESYPYEADEEALRRAGFDVLVFIASREEDLGRITCGNAILSGSLPLVPYHESTESNEGGGKEGKP